MEATAENIKKAIAANPPRPYDLNNPAEHQRLFRELRGYINTCQKEHHGTDWEGRMHTADALKEILQRGLKLNI